MYWIQSNHCMNDLKYLYFEPFIHSICLPSFIILEQFTFCIILFENFFSGPKLQCVTKPWGPTNTKRNILSIKPIRCTNFSNLFLEWNSTCFGQFFCPSPGVFHCTQQWYVSYRLGWLLASRIRMEPQFLPDPARKLSAKQYDLYHCCVYSGKLLIMDRGTVRNM